MRSAATVLRGLAALIAGLVFAVAVPVGLISFVGWPLPTSLPTIDRIQLALRSGIDPQLLINTLAVVVWIVWIQIAITLAAEVVAAIRGRAARRLPVLPGLQPAVAQLVAAVTLAVATLGPLRAVPVAASTMALSPAPSLHAVSPSPAANSRGGHHPGTASGRVGTAHVPRGTPRHPVEHRRDLSWRRPTMAGDP